MGYSFQLAAMGLLYAPPNIQDNTYHGHITVNKLLSASLTKTFPSFLRSGTCVRGGGGVDHALTCVRGGPRTHLCEGGGGVDDALTCVRGGGGVDHALTCVRGVEGGPHTHLCEGLEGWTTHSPV